jgi:TPR repeat protein
METGNSDATFELAEYWFNCEKRDLPKAVELYQKAADANHTEGNFFYGVIHFDGINGEKDIPLGIRYLTRAYEQGHPRASAYLSFAHRYQINLSVHLFVL